MRGASLEEEVAALAQHAAPGRGRRLDAEAEEGDVALGQDGVGDIERRRDDDRRDRGIPRGHMDILVDGKIVGQTTSGTFSPTLKVGIALGLVDSAYKIGDEVSIDVRGRSLVAEIVKLPMVAPHVK